MSRACWRCNKKLPGRTPHEVDTRVMYAWVFTSQHTNELGTASIPWPVCSRCRDAFVDLFIPWVYQYKVQ